MICPDCKKNDVTVHIKTNINGVESETHLCDACSKKRGGKGFEPLLAAMNELLAKTGPVATPAKQPLEQLFQLLSQGAPAGPTKRAPVSTCSACGLTLKDFQEKGVLGCAACYDTFRQTLRSITKKIHGFASHKGQKPNAPQDEAKSPPRESKIQLLRKKLERAVQSEHFEEAAKLRDQIRQIEKGDKPS